MANVKVALTSSLPDISVHLRVNQNNPVEQATITLASLLDGTLTGINLPESLQHTRNGAFSGCHKLQSIIVPKNVDTIGSNAFTDSAIQTINLNKSYKAITGQPWGATNATVNWLQATKAHVTITQTEHQTITVTTDDGLDHTDSFDGYVNMVFTVKIVVEDGYTAGTLSTLGGTITEDTEITATEATEITTEET
jgi:hypothetical protein